MKTYGRMLLVAGVVCALLMPGVLVLAADEKAVWDKESRENLRGLKGVLVSIEPQEPEVEKAGLATETVKTDVELRLRMGGIKVFSKEEWLRSTGYPFVRLSLNVLRVAPGMWVYHTRASLYEKVHPLRRPLLKRFASTWESPGWIGMTGKTSDIRDAVKDQVDIFINEYLAANPK